VFSSCFLTVQFASRRIDYMSDVLHTLTGRN